MTSRSIASRLLLLLFSLLMLAAPARADVFNLGNYTFLRSERAGEFDLLVSLPETVATSAPVIWPQGCSEVSEDRQSMAGRAQLSFSIRCNRPIVRTDVIKTPWVVDGAAFTSTGAGATVQTALPVEDNKVTLPIGETVMHNRPLPDIAVDYITQGIFHILGGWDHLAFILCLCLLTRGRTLLLLVTTFTLGHSISLALAFFDVLQVPAPPVEAVIALSIAFMAREALLARQQGGENAATRVRYMIVVGSFGLLHGLGFASVLHELGVAPHERVSGLIFFNVGVEIGQLVFVSAVLTVMAAASRVGRAEVLRLASLYGAGAVGGFWMIQRVASFTLGIA